MKRLLFLSVLFCLATINLSAQMELPYNLNGAFISDSKGFKIIKTTRTYESDDNMAETYNYFDGDGLNYETVSFYKGEKQGYVKLTYDDNGRLSGFKDYSQWINTYDSSNSRYWDSTLVSWENHYKYDSSGNLIFGLNQWYDENQNPIFRCEFRTEYNENGQISKKTEYYFDLSDPEYRISFEPDPAEFSSDRSLPNHSIYLDNYKYPGDTIVIEYYFQDKLRSIQKAIKKDSIEKEFLYDLEGNLLQTTTRTFDKNNNLVQEKCVGDCEISKYGGYRDGISYDQKIYTYSSTGLLLKETFINSKYNSKMYIDYEYIK